MTDVDILSASYLKYSDKRQLVDDTEWLEDDENSEDADVSAKHLHFVTDPSLSSWRDQDAAAFHSNSRFGKTQTIVKRFVEHFGTRVASLLLVLIDVIVVIGDFSTPNKSEKAKNAVQVITLFIVILFLIEIVMRIFASGKMFFKKWLEVLDLVIILVSFSVTVIYFSITFHHKGYAKFIIVGRLIRILLFFRFASDKKQFERASRRIVSQNKRRYKKDGFDLDLTYMTDSVIAMSFPSSGKHRVYRNPIREVVRFFDTKHPGHYKIYNLCSERAYDHSLFHDQVYRLKIDDHNVPKLSELVEFCKDVKTWLDSHPENVVAIHCKGGKGRTGTAICSWFLASGKFRVSQESLEYFGKRRTDLTVGKTFQGVETPSQSRFVGYMEKIIYELDWKIPSKVEMKIESFKISGIKSIGNGNGSDLHFEIIIDGSVLLASKVAPGANNPAQVESLDELTIALQRQVSPTIAGETKIKFYSTNKKVPKGYDDCAFFFWFHTGFIKENSLTLQRNEIDNAHKSKTWKTFKDNFSIDLTFYDN